MTFALDGAVFKIIWAHQHLNELKKHIGVYFDHTPYVTPSYRQGDLIIVESPRLYAPPHMDIGGIIGDCLCAMMASLDYTIWELMGKYFGQPLIPKHLGGKDAMSFPLYNDPVKWQQFDFAANRAAHYKFPAAVIDEITAAQPYNAGYEPLWFLHVLVNGDKHRLPLLTEAHIKSGDLSVSFGGEAATVRQSFASHVAVQAPPLTAATNFSLPMQVKTDVLTQFVAFGDSGVPRKPVEVLLEEMLVCVERVNATFTRFFA